MSKIGLVAGADAIIAALFLGFGLYYLIVSFESTGERDAAAIFVFAGFWMGVNAFAVYRRILSMVIAFSVPVVLVAAAFALVLVFAPLAWGPSNMPAVYVLQAIATLVTVIQIAAIAAVYASNRSAPMK